MVVVGGITRLTGSGLSMVDWHPLMGALPPMSEDAWQAVFLRYQQSPQYAQVNHWMTLADFKQIFFWEYFHRLLGRLIGVAFFLPCLVFVLQRRLRGAVAVRAGVAFLLGGAQGLLGWFMVKSGLVDVPEVSHFRLAAHLSLAFFVAQWVQWLWMQLRWPRRTEGEAAGAGAMASMQPAIWGFVALLSLQIVYGAFMAGKRAGKIFATFPDMNGSLWPAGWHTGDSALHDLLHNPIAIHATHRTVAWLVAAAAIALAVVASRRAERARERRIARIFGALVVLQVALGAATVMTSVAIPWAVAHQGVALLLLSASTALAYVARGPTADPTDAA
ncbi:MAG: hypothetical protein RIT45_2549 [Pseudomonadota bacterium]